MRAEVVSMTADNLDMEAIRRGGDILKQGGLVAFPTETVYGLGGDALNPQASMKIYAAKGRPSDNPLIVHIAEFDKLIPIVAEVPEKAKILAEKYWPGPLTMILPKSDIVPQETTGGLDSVAVRFPSDRIAPVSYTHLDVYKRQDILSMRTGDCGTLMFILIRGIWHLDF